MDACSKCESKRITKYQGYYFCLDCNALLDEVPP